MQLSSANTRVTVNDKVQLQVELEPGEPEGEYHFHIFPVLPIMVFRPGPVLVADMKQGVPVVIPFVFDRAGDWRLDFRLSTGAGVYTTIPIHVTTAPPAAPTQVQLVPRATGAGQGDIALWDAIRSVTDTIRFQFFDADLTALAAARGPINFYGTAAYNQLRLRADEFLTERVLGALNDPQKPPARPPAPAAPNLELARSYVTEHAAQQGFDGGDDADFNAFLGRVPFVELIWSYWLEEGMLAQSLNHILARFQNRRIRGAALDRFDLNPLLPLRNLLWGFAEDESNRLTLRRRAAEYEYEYGLRLIGRAVPPSARVVERRTRFLEAFHGLLHVVHAFFKERDDRTVDADAFPVFEALREVHLILAQGAHNQYADLPLTARAEMLTMQSILARDEMRLFLGGRPMVPYEEAWMDRVDAMKGLHGWADASITHFFELARFGERIVLSVRHGAWNDGRRNEVDAAIWADAWRSEIQKYTHAYRAVTGADLIAKRDATMPSTLLARRLAGARRRA